MFKETKRKIIVSIMTALILLWVGTLGIIYVTTYFSVIDRNYNMLKSHANAQLVKYDHPKDDKDDKKDSSKPSPDKDDGNVPPDGNNSPTGDNGPDKDSKDSTPPTDDTPPLDDNPTFVLSTFYLVTFDSDGNLYEVINGQPTLHSDEELENLALEIIDIEDCKGTVDSLLYRCVKDDKYTLIAFMDNTVFQESISELFKYTLIYGSLALIVFFILAVYASRKIIEPLEKGYARQRQFISDASHELKTPIAVINANAEVLSRELGDNKWVSNIQYENDQMADLVCQLLELARTESVIPKMETFDFSHLVNGEVLPFETIFFEKGLTLNMDISPDVKISGNKISLRQLVSILIENALTYAKSPSEIHIELTKDSKFAYFSVTNDGDEIPEDLREVIFNRFYRSATARNEKGHYGLGLAIAKAITMRHKGSIQVTCPPGKVKFTVKLPLSHKSYILKEN